jgi:NADP-dependent 3-hydroxy acid dehydrogenase YdfG
LGGGPDIIVNNAGIFAIRGIEETSTGEFDSMLGLNLSAPLAIIRAFLPDMKSRGTGHIVTIGSIADRQIFAGNAEYSATKFGARAIHEVLREETRGTGVRSTLVSPAAVDTDIWEPIHYYGSDAKPDRTKMLPGSSVASAVLYALTQPDQVNIDEIRLSRS